MNDQARAAREDLAFLRSVAEDKDPLPWVIGAHLFFAGIIFSPTAFLAWLSLSNIAQIPEWLLTWGWVPAMAIYVPVWFWLNRRAGPVSLGPRKVTFAAAWTAMSLMTLVILACTFIVSRQVGPEILMFIPALLLTLYGGAWMVISIVHRNGGFALIGVGGFASAIACALLFNQPTEWLIMGLGILGSIAAPGLSIMLHARPAR